MKYMTVWKRSLEILKQNKIYSMLGLATRSRKTDSGEFMTEKSIKSGKAYLVMIADDASDNTKKEFMYMCKFYHVPFVIYGTKEELGHAMGKAMRASLAVNDEGFSKALMKLLNVTEVVK